MTEALTRAIVMAATAHNGQTDKGGEPYILHPLRVMLACRTEEQRIVAVLHDAVEDAGLDLCLISRQFGSDVGNAVNALTRRVGEAYETFINRCALDPIALEVKLHDLTDNMDTSRLKRDMTAEDVRRQLKYTKAKTALQSARQEQTNAR